MTPKIDQKALEAACRALCEAKGVGADTLFQINVFTGDEPFDHQDERGLRYIYAWRKQAQYAEPTITAYLAATTLNTAETAEPVARSVADVCLAMAKDIGEMFIGNRPSEVQTAQVAEFIYKCATTGGLAWELALIGGPLTAPQPLSISSGEDRAAIVEAAKSVLKAYDECSGAEPSLSVLMREIDVDLRAAIRKLSEKPE